MGKHKCSWDTVAWDEGFRFTGLGDTVTRYGECSVCRETIREVFTLVGHYKGEHGDKEIDLNIDESEVKGG